MNFVTGFDANCGLLEPGGQFPLYGRACELDLAFLSDPSLAHHLCEWRPASIAPSNEERSRLPAEGARLGAHTPLSQGHLPRRWLRSPSRCPRRPGGLGGDAGGGLRAAGLRAGLRRWAGVCPGCAAPGDQPHHLRVSHRLVKGCEEKASIFV